MEGSIPISPKPEVNNTNGKDITLVSTPPQNISSDHSNDFVNDSIHGYNNDILNDDTPITHNSNSWDLIRKQNQKQDISVWAKIRASQNVKESNRPNDDETSPPVYIPRTREEIEFAEKSGQTKRNRYGDTL